jgi:hypothetical protein
MKHVPVEILQWFEYVDFPTALPKRFPGRGMLRAVSAHLDFPESSVGSVYAWRMELEGARMLMTLMG